MAMSFPLPRYTVDMVRAFPDDGQRYELVEGILLVTPAPASDHQIVIARLLAAVHAYLGDHGPAYVVSPGEIELAPTLQSRARSSGFPLQLPARDQMDRYQRLVVSRGGSESVVQTLRPGL